MELPERMSIRTAASRIGTNGIARTKGCPAWAPWTLGFLALVASAGLAIAQSPVCSQIRSELAQIGNSSSGGGPTAQSNRLRVELSRIRLAERQNDCNRSGFLIFGGPPPVCTPLRAQAGQLEAQIRQIEGTGGASNPRRAQLVAALDRYGCFGQPQQQRGVIYAAPGQPSLFDRLFGDDNNQRGGYNGEQLIDPDAEQRERLGGRMAICVRTCDGFFFPVNFEGIGARDEYSQVCQSLCPEAETRVYFMPLGADVERAASRDGSPYMSLPAAKKFQTQARDPACACKQPGQTWVNAMKGVEDLVETRKGDIIVTQEQALSMSRPKDAPRITDKKGKKPELPKAPPSTEQEPSAAEIEKTLPTGGNASAGIGPRVSQDRTISAQGGTKQQVIGADGTKRQVRNVAPELTGKELPIDLRGEARP